MSSAKTFDTVFLLTADYPYGQKSETFIEPEIPQLERHFEKVVIFPIGSVPGEMRTLPDSVYVSNLFREDSSLKIGRFFRHLPFFLRQLLMEIRFTDSQSSFIKDLRQNIYILVKAMHRGQLLLNFMKQHEIDPKRVLYYSYWMNEGALMLALLKSKKLIPGYVSRVHGFDLYEDRSEGKYLPFRYIIMKHADAIYSVSGKGAEHLRAKNLFPSKVHVSYLGTNDYGPGPFNHESRFTVVSCSGLAPLKRVPMICEILSKLDFPVTWHHLGDGMEREKLLQKSQQLPSNITFKFHGQVKNDEVLHFYQNYHINLFLNLSESEGLPVSVMEAMSFGIPVMATDAGGTREIVNSDNGVLLPVDFDPAVVSQQIRSFRISDRNSDAFRKQIRSQWNAKFNADKNYFNFYLHASNEIATRNRLL